MLTLMKLRIHKVSPYTKACIRTHAVSQKERRVHVRKLSFFPWYLVRGIDPWPQVLGPRYWSYVVLDHGIERGLNLYKEDKIIRPRGEKGESIEYLMKCEI